MRSCYKTIKELSLQPAIQVGVNLLPQTFSKFKPRPEKWDLDQSYSHTDPVLFSLPTAGHGTIRGYFVPARQRPCDKLLVAFHGNNRACAAMMTDFWAPLGNVDLLLIHLPGYGTLPQDRSDEIPRTEVGKVVARFRAMVEAVKETFISGRAGGRSVDWSVLHPQVVRRRTDAAADADAGDMFTFTPADEAALPRTFAGARVTVFGRSVGAAPASWFGEEYAQILFSPLVRVGKIEPAPAEVGPARRAGWAAAVALSGWAWDGLATEFNGGSVCVLMEREELVGHPDEGCAAKKILVFAGATHATAPDEKCLGWFRSVLDGETPEQ